MSDVLHHGIQRSPDRAPEVHHDAVEIVVAKVMPERQLADAT